MSIDQLKGSLSPFVEIVGKKISFEVLCAGTETLRMVRGRENMLGCRGSEKRRIYRNPCKKGGACLLHAL